MEEEFFNVPLGIVKRDLQVGLFECQKRCLYHSVKWLSEMNHGLLDIKADWTNSGGDDESQQQKQHLGSNILNNISPSECDNYLLAKSYFDVREYDRAAYFVRNCESSVPRFLYYYATYMAREKRRLDSITDNTTTSVNESTHVKELTDLLNTLRTENSRCPLDGYGMYLYGIVLKALGLDAAAVQVLRQSINMAPMLWSAYVELAPLITDKEKILPVNFLGNHWMRHIFVAHTYIDLFMNDEGIKAYEDLRSVGFSKCLYVTSQIALAHHNKRDVEKAIEVFQQLQDEDPYRLDNLDIYSNLLFVKEQKTEMAALAHKAVSINKYRPETCCVIGNYFSIRTDHQMAITYFQRALKLNPKYLAAWTLMGHEFMELKNTNAAIQSYRKAVEVNKRDYRAWYGLGQSYEILKMHYYSLYYFKISHQLRPYDSRMLVALGETYEKLEKNEIAIKCYSKACDVGDIEGIAMFKLAILYEKIGDYETAVQFYIMYCDDERAASSNKQSLFHGYMTIANYYERKGNYEQAAHYAYKCLESDDRKAEAKSLLKTIENKRRTSEGNKSINTSYSSKASMTTRRARTRKSSSKLATANSTDSTDSSSHNDDDDHEDEDEMEMEVIADYELSRKFQINKHNSREATTPSTNIGHRGHARELSERSTTAAVDNNESESMEISMISID